MRSWVLLVLAALAAAAPGAALAGVYDRAGRAVVWLRVEGVLLDGRQHLDHGTGFVVDPAGYVVTAGHVAPDPGRFVDGAFLISGRLPGVEQGALQAREPDLRLEVVSKTAPPHDVAVLRIVDPPAGLPVLSLCDRAPAEAGLALLGYPGGQSFLSLRRGNVAVPAAPDRPIEVAMAMNPGDSGAPVLIGDRLVAAVAVAGSARAGERQEQHNFAVPIGRAIDLLPKTATHPIPELYDACEEPVAAAGTERAPYVQAFTVSRTFARHELGVSTETFVDTFEAPAGFRFAGVLAREEQGLNHAPDGFPTPAFAADGRTMSVRYRLQSGPMFDRWRGWIDLVLHVRLEPAA